MQELPFTLNATVAVDGVVAEEDFEPVVVAPGETASISVAVTRCPGKPTDPENYACETPEPATNARVLIVAVDKAYFELSEVPLVKFDEGTNAPKDSGCCSTCGNQISKSTDRFFFFFF